MTNINETVAKLLEENDLFWEVESKPMFIKQEFDGQQKDFETGYYGTVRKDNGEVFGVFKEGYEVFQNWELAELVYRVADEAQLTVKSAGHFKGGARVYIQTQNGDVNGIGENKDTIHNYISAINTFDGSSALKWGYSNLVVSCQNTFWAVQKKLTNSVRHTQNMRTMIDQALQDIDDARRIEQEMIDTFWRLAEIALTETAVKKVMNAVLSLDEDKKMSTRKQNQMMQLAGCITDETAQKGATMWGLFNGVTKYTTHYHGGDMNREHSKVLGVANRIDNKVLNILNS